MGHRARNMQMLPTRNASMRTGSAILVDLTGSSPDDEVIVLGGVIANGAISFGERGEQPVSSDNEIIVDASFVGNVGGVTIDEAN